jgi:hypothetical protein
MPFREGRAAVCRGCMAEADGEHRAIKGGAWGYIDRKGDLVIPLRYEAAAAFENGKARVRQKNSWITIDGNGKQTNRSGGE